MSNEIKISSSFTFTWLIRHFTYAYSTLRHKMVYPSIEMQSNWYRVFKNIGTENQDYIKLPEVQFEASVEVRAQRSYRNITSNDPKEMLLQKILQKFTKYYLKRSYRRLQNSTEIRVRNAYQ